MFFSLYQKHIGIWIQNFNFWRENLNEHGRNRFMVDTPQPAAITYVDRLSNIFFPLKIK